MQKKIKNKNKMIEKIWERAARGQGMAAQKKRWFLLNLFIIIFIPNHFLSMIIIYYLLLLWNERAHSMATTRNAIFISK